MNVLLVEQIINQHDDHVNMEFFDQKSDWVQVVPGKVIQDFDDKNQKQRLSV